MLNNDQDGLNYPAHKWGTGYYMSNLLDGQAGPWFNNINATPVSAAPNSVYGTVGIQRLQHNLPAVQAFRASAANAVTQALPTWARSTTSASRWRTRSCSRTRARSPTTRASRRCRRIFPRTRRVHAGARRPHGTHRPGLVRHPRDSVARRHRSVRLEHRPARGRRGQPVPAGLSEQADHCRGIRSGLEQRLLLEPQLLGVRHRARARWLRPAVRGPPARRRVRRDVVLVRRSRRRKRAERSRSPTARSRISR